MHQNKAINQFINDKYPAINSKTSLSVAVMRKIAVKELYIDAILGP